MTTKIKGTEGIEFPDASVQATAADAGPSFSARRVTIQSLTVGTDAVLICDIKDFDTANAYNSSTGRFNPKVAGYYQINGIARLASDVDVTASSLNIMKNGTLNLGASADNFTTSDNVKSRTVANIVYLNGSTDYIELVVNVYGTPPAYVWAASQFPAVFSAALVRKA